MKLRRATKLAVGLTAAALLAVPGLPASSVAKIYAQKLVEETLAAHPEVVGVEIAAKPPAESHCVTIASTQAKDIGEKCDQDEFRAIRADSAIVEKEKEGGKEVFDVTVPIHGADGKIIATAGIDFKPYSDQSESRVAAKAAEIAKELESKVKSKGQLFAPIS